MATTPVSFLNMFGAGSCDSIGKYPRSSKRFSRWKYFVATGFIAGESPLLIVASMCSRSKDCVWKIFAVSLGTALWEPVHSFKRKKTKSAVLVSSKNLYVVLCTGSLKLTNLSFQ